TESNNYGNSSSFLAHEWTWNGDPGRRKSLINFDLSIIPVGSTIIDARLDLYGYPDSPDNGHSSVSGSNESVLNRITSTWLEQTVTWNSQPSITTVNQVILSQSVSSGQDYIGINVTDMVQDMINDPLNSFGFMLSIVQPSYYRAMIFASSDHPNPLKHPRISITYDSPQILEPNVIDLIPDTTVCDHELFEFNAATPCAGYLWSTGSSNSNFSTSEAGDYWLQLTTNSGVFIDSFTVIIEDCSSAISLPNVFTPNGDHINDIFTPTKLKGIQSMNTRILNRWGQLVFETSSKLISWDGTTKNAKDVIEGTYFWSITYTTDQGNTDEVHGFVQLVK
ncbi:MAG: DNRLRE domain-containing protein, partial [Crocinitomicaceae bacterium]|nr:DNRLRE domain-containing protein [Crocinitomicaceae bacterium]